MLRTYDEFADAADKAGAMALSGRFLPGFPALEDLTSPAQWHTGDADTDPWQWKDRAAEEKRLAFGSILGGRKGFISRELYPLFFSACRPAADLEARYRAGHVPKTVLDVYRLFRGGSVLDTADIHRLMNVSKGAGVSAVDSAVVRLQSAFYITVCGSRRKVGPNGREYGWPANTYRPAEDWARDWLDGENSGGWTKSEARAELLGRLSGPGKADTAALAKLLFKDVL